mgnify:CR=1 FL=1
MSDRWLAHLRSAHWRAHQNPQQIQPALFPAGEFLDLRPLKRPVKQEVFQHLRGSDLAVGSRDILSHFFDIVNDPHGIIHVFILLGEISHADRLSYIQTARVRLYDPIDNPKERGFSAPFAR